VQSVTTNAGTPATLFSGVHYNAANQVTSDTLGTGETEVYTYTKKNQLQAKSTALGSTTTYSYSLTFAPNGDVTASNDSVNGNWTYSYDPFNRLVGSNENNGASVYSYVYDRFGNRWQQNGQHTFLGTFNGNNNRVDGFSYDAAGNLLADATHTYSYDAENRLISVDNGTTATYSYDADGKRVHRTGVINDTCDATGNRDYVYDLAGHWVLEVHSGGVACRYEIYAGGRHFVSDVDGHTLFDHSDWLGTVRLRYDYAGPNSNETCTSLPFGDALSCTNGDQSTIHFTGKERDGESGLDNFGARYNASRIGRFMSPDWSDEPDPLPYAQLDNPQSLNLYAYVANNPVGNADDDGHDLINDFGDFGKFGNNGPVPAATCYTVLCILDRLGNWFTGLFGGGGKTDVSAYVVANPDIGSPSVRAMADQRVPGSTNLTVGELSRAGNKKLATGLAVGGAAVIVGTALQFSGGEEAEGLALLEG
jgi:RHS repeat-associated protein